VSDPTQPKGERRKMDSKKISFGVFCVSFCLIIAGIIYFRPEPLMFLPVVVSALVMFLQSRVNRYAFFVGAINAVLYTIAYIKMSLYATAAYALLVSGTLQVLAFINWSKHTDKNETDIKSMTWGLRIKLLTGMALLWGIIYLIFAKFNSEYLVLDSTITVLGIIATILSTLRYKEYLPLQILLKAFSLFTYILMLSVDPSRIIWVISGANGIICSFIAIISINRRKKQCTEK